MMKKVLLIFSLIIISLGCVACGKTPNISYEKEYIQINFDETYTIEEDDIKIENSDSHYQITILNTDIAELDGMTILPKNKGETHIRFEIVDEDVFVDIPLMVTYIIFAQNATIEKSEIVININDTQEIYNRITLNEGCNEKPQISYDSNIVGYNFITGRIEPKKVGSTTVIVLFNSCNVSFTITVVDKVYTKSLEIDEHTLYVGDSGVFAFQVFPTLANTYRFYSFSDSIQVGANGEYSAKNEGIIDVYVEYYIDDLTPVVKIFRVNIISEIKAFDFEIKNIDNTTPTYLLKEKQYKIVIPNIQNVKKEDISVADNFEVVRIDVFENSVEIKGGFESAGAQEVAIRIVSNSNIIECAKNKTIYSIEDIEVKAKWSAYNQNPATDGKYHIGLEESPNFPSYLKFYLSINGQNITEDFDVYDITTTKKEASKTFEPSVVGEFVFGFEFMGQTVGVITVVVE